MGFGGSFRLSEIVDEHGRRGLSKKKFTMTTNNKKIAIMFGGIKFEGPKLCVIEIGSLIQHPSALRPTSGIRSLGEDVFAWY